MAKALPRSMELSPPLIIRVPSWVGSSRSEQTLSHCIASCNGQAYQPTDMWEVVIRSTNTPDAIVSGFNMPTGSGSKVPML